VANGLWQKLENRHASNVANRENRDNNSSLLYQALMAGNNKGNNNSFVSNTEQASQGFDGFANLAKTLKTNNAGSSLGIIGNTANSLIGGAEASSLPTTLGGASSGSAITDAITGAGGSGSAITDAINANVGGSTASNSGGFFSKLKGGSGGGTPWALIGSLAKGGYNKLSNKTDKDYSDTEEAIIYPLQGASMGAQFGPWGALGGALYGLSYGFKDDTNKWVGIKEGSFWDKLRHPIGMGDGGGFIDLG
jgi:hypothetical protein